MRALLILLTLSLSLTAAPALAAKKPAKKKAAQTESCAPIDTNNPSLECYRFQGKGPYGRCEPQSLPYARCRTGIQRCRGNCELSPIGWYQCEEKLGFTSPRPTDGCVLILGDNSRHRMKTGHVFVVEKARDMGGGNWELTLSHTNHDRKCAIETNVRATYDARNKHVAMKSGAWSPWGKQLSALGFIHREKRTAQLEEGR